MPSNFNDTTPAAPAGSTNVKWQTDGSGNNSAYAPGVIAPSTITKTTTYPIAAGDSGALIIANGASAFTITLLGTAPTAGTFYVFKNINVGVLTISRNSLTIDGLSQDLKLAQGDSVLVMSDGSNYKTGYPRPVSIAIFAPGVGSNGQVLAYFKMDRTATFPASAPNSYGVASAAATGSTTFTFKKNGSSFATAVFSGGGTTAAWTQASDALFAAGDIFEIDGPATADATLANIGLTLQGYRF